MLIYIFDKDGEFDEYLLYVYNICFIVYSDIINL